MRPLTSEELSIIHKIRQLSAEQKAHLTRVIDDMRQEDKAVRTRQRLAAFDRTFGAWSDMTDGESEQLWQEIHAMRQHG